MAVLITLKPIRLNGTILQPGENILVKDEQGLINKGYARRLTRVEARAIIGNYVEYADMLFNKKTI